MKTPINIFWFRRDLRLDDNAGLFHALINNLPVLPIFIFDQDILVRFPKKDARVDFIFETLQNLRIHLEENYESSISIYYGNPLEIFKGLITQYTIDTVFTNHDYEPYALLRDNEIREFLSLKSISFKPYKDQVIFEKDEIVKNDGTPYMVYTPYMKKWKSIFHEQQLNFFDSKGSLNRLIKLNSFPNVTLNEIGFEPSEQKIQPFKLSTDLIDNYEATRNFPAIQGTSHLGPHLRFGTVSIRKMVHSAANTTNEVFGKNLFGVNSLCKYYGIFHIRKINVSNHNMIESNGAIMKLNFRPGVKEKQVILWLMQECENSIQLDLCIIVFAC